jgi:hypothetical protein
MARRTGKRFRTAKPLLSAKLKLALLQAAKLLRRRYVRGLVSDIVVGREKAVISGPRAVIAAAATAGAFTDTFPTLFVRDWRTGENSNSEPQDSQFMAVC